MKNIRVFAPATVANVGCGFDTMGFAFEGAGDIIKMELNNKVGDIEYLNKSGVDLPSNIEENIMTPTLRAMFAASNYKGGVKVTIEQKIIPGSGIGSSASAVASASYAFNQLIGNKFSNNELIDFALEGECMASGSKHADNVAPAVLGGFVLVRDYSPIDIVEINMGSKIYCAVVHPHIEVKTKDSRAVIKSDLPLSVAIRQWANLGAMISGLGSGNYSLIGRAIKDYIAEPYRKKFIPGYMILKEECIKAGAIGANISGSGPSVFALCASLEDAKNVSKTMDAHFKRLNIPADVYASAISNKGTRVIE